MNAAQPPIVRWVETTGDSPNKQWTRNEMKLKKSAKEWNITKYKNPSIPRPQKKNSNIFETKNVIKILLIIYKSR